jgi:hypothetical protein
MDSVIRQTDHRRPATHAAAFHSLAGSFLVAEGFALVDDPGIIGRYGGSSALYRSERGLFLSIGFEPIDGSYAGMFSGREWTSKGRRLFLSNQYSKLAQRFGLDVPETYELMGDREQQNAVVEKMVTDLRRSLPIVVSKVSLNDLLAVENDEPYGAAARMRTFGMSDVADVEISGFSEN